MRAAAVFLLAGLAACASPSVQSPLDPKSPPIAWATPLIGTPPRAWMVMRPPQGLSPEHVDSGWFHHDRSAAQKVAQAMATARQVDSYGDPEVLCVIHGAPPGQGVFHSPESADKDDVLFMLPSGTWILGRGIVADRVNAYVPTHPSDPPWLTSLPNIAVETTKDVDPNVVRKELGDIRGGDNVIAVGIVGYPPSPFWIGVKLVFRDEDVAKASYADAQRFLLPKNPRSVIERYGTVLVLKSPP
jgi:hypothetical protein